ncbi:hypothetical protein [Microcystis phage Mwe-JY05]
MTPGAALFLLVFVVVFGTLLFLMGRGLMRSAAARQPIRPGSDAELAARLRRVEHDQVVDDYRRGIRDDT